ncbi:hypothetical protein BOTBODRAFT_178248 [Botryobasidium botryosum FD-172 SS1]|nr:hypothetical protein BOTBODRAFT_178248 [Botryobasidium botryosum FD-172 SS1]
MSASPGDSSDWAEADAYGVPRYDEPAPMGAHDRPWDFHASAALAPLAPIAPSYAPPYGPPPMGYHASHHGQQYHAAAVPVHAVHHAHHGHHGGVGMPADAAYGVHGGQVPGWGREMSDARSDVYYYH